MSPMFIWTRNVQFKKLLKTNMEILSWFVLLLENVTFVSFFTVKIIKRTAPLSSSVFNHEDFFISSLMLSPCLPVHEIAEQ